MSNAQGTGTNEFRVPLTALEQPRPRSYDDLSNQDRDLASSGVTINTWTWLCVQHNLSSRRHVFYINGLAVGTSNENDDLSFGNWNMKKIAFGANDANTNDWTGQLDEYQVLNGTVTAEQIWWAYNVYQGGGRPQETPVAGGSTGGLTINLTSPADNTVNSTSTQAFEFIPVNYGGPLQNCSLYTNETGSWDISFSNTTAPNNDSANNMVYVLSEGEVIWNVGCWNSTSETFATSNRTLKIDTTNPSVTTNLDSYYTLNLYLEVNTTDLNPNNLTVTSNCTAIESHNSSIASPFILASNYSITSCSLGEYQTNISACDDAGNCNTSTFSWNAMGLINISAISITNSSTINSFDVYVNNTYQGSTAIGYFELSNVSLADYQIGVRGTGFANGSTNYTISASYTAITFYLYTMNSFNITFYDEMDSLIADDTNITVEFISDIANYTYTTVDGTLYVDLLSPADYVIRYKGSNVSYGGRKRSYYLSLTNNTHDVLDLYLIKSPDSNATVYVYDQVSLALLEGAMIYLQKRLVDNNYYTVAMYETGTNGVAYFEVDKYDEYYMFLVDYPWKTRKYTSDKLYIEGDIINLYVTTTDELGQDYYELDGITYGITFSDTTNEFTATWTDSELIATEFCLYIRKYGYYGSETVNSSCSGASAGSITLGGMDENVTYYALLEATIDGEPVTLATAWKEFVEDELSSGRFGIFMTIMIVIVFSFLTALSIYAVILGSSALAFAKLLGILPIGWPAVISIMIVAIIVSIIIESAKR